MRHCFGKAARLACLAILLDLSLGAFFCAAAWADEKPKDKVAPKAEVLRVGDSVVTAPAIAGELRWIPPEILAGVQENDNAAQRFAMDWYTRRLFAIAAEQDGLFDRSPGLKEAAAEAGYRMIAMQYIADLQEQRFKPTRKELKQYYLIHKEEVCAVPARYRVARAGVVSGRRAGPEERAAADKRLSDMEARLGAGEPFAQLADELSDLPSRLPGGEIGWLTEADSSGSPGFAEIQQLEVGKWSPPISTKDGRVLYFLMEKQEPRVLTLGECDPRIRKALNRRFRKEMVLGQVDLLAEEKGASFNIDAFVRLLRAARSTIPPRAPNR